MKSHITRTRWWRTWVTSAEPRLLHPLPMQPPPARHSPSHKVSDSFVKEMLHLTSSAYRLNTKDPLVCCSIYMKCPEKANFLRQQIGSGCLGPRVGNGHSWELGLEVLTGAMEIF